MSYSPPSKTATEPQQVAMQMRVKPQTENAEFSDMRDTTADTAQLQALMHASPIHNNARSLAQLMANHSALQMKLEPTQFVEDSRQFSEELQTQFDDTAQLEPIQLAEPPPKPNNTGLPDQLKTGVESLSGISLDHVKVHYNSSEPAQLNALAYAQGSDIHVGPGQEKHLPHEAWHVVQQAQGRVRPTKQMKEGVPVNDDEGLEHEADVMGVKAMSLSVSDIAQRKQGEQILLNSSVIQQKVIQLHKGKDNYDETEDDVIIYIVVLKADDTVVYVGQTEEAVGIDTRFAQHQKVHDWPSSTHKIVRKEAGSWTRLEASCAEQYWIDHYGFDNLENDRNQITKAHFLELMEWAEEEGKTIFRGKDIGFPAGWKPKN